jgi:hypothetical protein
MKKLIRPTLAVTFTACLANPVLDVAYAAPASKGSIKKHASKEPVNFLGYRLFACVS